MKQQIWKTSEDLKLDPSADYINDCCRYCDVVLEKLKNGIAEKCSVDPDHLIAGQEDWGWYLEFQKGEIIYILSLSYQERDSGGAHNFVVVCEAQKLEKGFFFDRKIEAPEEADEFARKIEAVARGNDFLVLED